MPAMSSKPLLDLLTSPWAIEPEKLREIQAVYAAHVRGEQIDIASIEARLGRPLASEQQSYTVNAAGVATLEVSGVMAPKANLLMQISGGVSTQMLADQIESMRADARVRSAALVWDSPGGNVLGIPAAAEALRALAADKPTVSLVRGYMASAAYWVGSAANAVYLEGATDVVGSLGVYQRLSWQDAQPNTLDMVRGKYKRVSVNGQPPSREVLAEAEAQLDYLYTVLVDAVAQHRGVTAEAVLQHMADGRLFTGDLAVRAGLADGMTTLAALVDQLASRPDMFRKRRKARIGAVALLSTGASHMEQDPKPVEMTREALQREYPALCDQLRSEARAEGAAAERGRIQAVRAQSLRGHEELIDKLAFDGTTTGPEAAVAVLNAERATADRRAADLLADTPAPLPAAVTESASDDPAAADRGGRAPSPMAAAQELSAAIVKKQAEASANGRTLSVVEALAIVKKEQSNG